MANKEDVCDQDNRSSAQLLQAFVKHQGILKRFISRYLRNTQDIEDVAQEAFLRAYRASLSEQIEQPKSLLFRIAKNVAVSELRLKSRQTTDYIEDNANPDVLLVGDSLEDEVLAREKLGIHCEAIINLPPQCRKVYILRKVYGMKHAEIAAHLGIAVSTVEKHLIRGVQVCDNYIRERTQGAAPAATPALSAAGTPARGKFT